MAYKYESVDCNICGSSDFEKISDKGKFGLPTNVVLCKDCGLGFLSPRWDAESYIQFYREEYDKYYRPHILKTKHTAQVKFNAIGERLSRLNLMPDRLGKILSVGSGEGENLKYFKSIFPEAELFAIEPSSESHRYLQKMNASLISESVDSEWHEPYEQQFDLIIMRHVLEHFMNPTEVLRKVRHVLAPEGILYIAVPNNLHHLKYLETNWFRNVHTYYFNRHSLKNIAAMTGLNILAIEEGDSYGTEEIFLFLNPGEEKSPDIKTEHFSEQLKFFKTRLRREKTVLFKGQRFMDKLHRKLKSI